jgi:DOPA 4,5-dioxygenase
MTPDQTQAHTAPADPAGIHAWHAHIYYDPATTRSVAARLREQLAAAFPEAVLGRWHDVPVGPHPGAMYQVLFQPGLFPGLVPFLALNRAGLTVLVHPETGRQVADHTAHALWLGAVLPLNTAVLPPDQIAPPLPQL